jgi:hypothetical protein
MGRKIGDLPFLGAMFRNPKMHRARKRIKNNIGIVDVPMPEGHSLLFRKDELEILDAYYESRQYDHLMPWYQAECNGQHVPLRQKAPKINSNFSKVLCQRLTSKLVGDDVFPKMEVEDDPETTEYLRMIVRASKIKSRILEPVRRHLNAGSHFVRFYIEDGAFVFEHYLSKYCYPILKPSGDLASIKIRYTYVDKDDLDQRGKPKVKWFQLQLTENADISYNNPEFEKDKEPVFQQTGVVEHNFGFVQGEWLRTAEVPKEVDGYSLSEDILDYCDELNYSLSQSSQATSYNQDPQLTFKNVDQEELDNVIRSATKSWNLGREGEATFLESGLNGVQVAMELRDKVRTNIMDIARIILMDPEKMVAQAQSGRALEILHGPMVDLVKELRPMMGQSLQNLVLKMALANLAVARQNFPSPVLIPPGYIPKSLSVTMNWPPVFAMTIEDLQKKVSVAQAATSSYLISEETGTRYVAKDFGVEDIEEERAKIQSQPVRNPFGGGF